MASNLECVGLTVRDVDELTWLVAAVLPSAIPFGSARGVDVVRWQDPGGARLVVALQDGQVVDWLPSFAGSAGARLVGVRMANDEVATADVVGEDGEQLTSFAVEPEQRALLDPAGGVGEIACEAAVTALGVDVAVFDDEAEFAASDASLLSEDDAGSEPPPEYVVRGWAWPPRMAAESFFSYSVFGNPREATAHARLTGTVLEAGRRRTVLTGQEFWVARVRTVGFEADLCLPAAEHPQAPHPGSVVAGTVFLVADLALDAPPVLDGLHPTPDVEAEPGRRPGFLRRLRG